MTHTTRDLALSLMPLIEKGDHMAQADVLGSMGVRIHLMIDDAPRSWDTHACLYSLGTLSRPRGNEDFVGRIRLTQHPVRRASKDFPHFHPTYHEV